MNLIIGWVIAVIVGLTSAQAESLTSYRQKYKESNEAAMALQSQQRVERIQSKLHAKSKIVINSDTTYPSMTVRPRRTYSSTMFKVRVQTIATTLRIEGLFGVPEVSDPKDDPVDVNRKDFESEYQKFEKALTDFDGLIDQIIVNASTVKSQIEAERVGDAGLKLESAMRREIAGHLFQQPVPHSLKGRTITIESALGKLDSVQIHDSIVDRLVFKSGEESTPVSLSMLINVRTLRDSYFVTSLAMLAAKLERDIDSYYKKDSDGVWVISKQNERALINKLSEDQQSHLVKLKMAFTIVKAMFGDAEKISNRLGLLSKAQIDFLIDLMLQLRGKDIPVDDEMGSLGIAERRDVEFYSRLNLELQQLEDFLGMEVPK